MQRKTIKVVDLGRCERDMDWMRQEVTSVGTDIIGRPLLKDDGEYRFIFVEQCHEYLPKISE